MSMTRADILTRAWLTLIVLSGVSTLAAAAITAGYDARIAGAIVLFLALMKALELRSIRLDELDLSPTKGRRGKA